MVGSLGYITMITGTPVRATVNLSAPTANRPAASVRFQAAPANNAVVYYGLGGMNIVTGENVLGVIAAPASATDGAFDFAEIIVHDMPAGLNLAHLYLQGTTGEIIIGSFTV